MHSPGLPGPKLAGNTTPTEATGGGFSLDMAPSSATESERFIQSRAGGVIVGRDGAPAGRVPEGSFLD
ncbi:MAG: hypothetical protein ABI200_04565, partial [Gaiellales bacterium]